MKKATLFILGMCFCIHVKAQIGLSPSLPQAPGFTPIVGPQNSASTSAQYQSPFPQVSLGGTASDILSRRQPGYHQISQSEQQREVAELVSELRKTQLKQSVQQQSKSSVSPNQLTEAKEITHRYYAALNVLTDMLDGKKPASISDAFYTIEAAFGNTYLSKAEFQRQITRSAAFIRTWMQQQKLDPHNNDALNLAIQKFMGEPLSIYKQTRQEQTDNGLQVKAETHAPFFYDYKDYQGNEDYRNFFATKCLATGAGQCNSMPRVYLCLAEALGAHASLSFAPQHSLIRYKDNNGVMRNYEATSNWLISDQWYQDNMFITPEAIRSGIYLDTLSREQMIANCIYDLAASYTWQCPVVVENGAFVYDCLQKAKPYFPRYNNLSALFLYSSLVKHWLYVAMEKHGITDPNKIESEPEAAKYLQELARNEAFIAKLGYHDMPAGMYDELLQEHEFKGKLQQAHHLDGKKKRNLFIEVNQ